MKARHVYLILAVLGFVIPYSQFVPWLVEHGLNVGLFFRELLANRISMFFSMDVIISAVVLLGFIQSEGKRLRVRLLWLPTIGKRRWEPFSSGIHKNLCPVGSSSTKKS